MRLSTEGGVDLHVTISSLPALMSPMPPRYFGLIPAAGNGSRFGGEIPKQYQALNGRAVLAYAIDALSRHTPLSKVYVIHAPDDRRCAQVIGSGNRVTALGCGGESRAGSIRNALVALRGELTDADWMVVHDAARPCMPKDALRRLILEVGDDKIGGLLALPVTGTLKLVDDQERAISTETREHLWEAQTPQLFRFGVLWEAYKANRALECVDDAQAVERIGLRPRIVAGSKANIEITFAADLALAETILRGE
jgi:2-C-methyl-D-erythritol 4-phosphate cytidylyltransferase